MASKDNPSRRLPDPDPHLAFDESWGPPVQIPPRDPSRLGSEPSELRLWLESAFDRLPPQLRETLSSIAALLFILAVIIGVWVLIWLLMS